MSLLLILSWVALVIQICFVTLSIAAGLYYIAELVEEYTSIARRIIIWMICATAFTYALFLFFDDLPWSTVMCGLVAQLFHGAIMKNFPFIRFLSASFCGALLMLVVNHLLAFKYFTSVYYPFTQVLAYFTICLWMVPLALFVSLSANDNVLPTVNEASMHMNNHDVVSNYFSRGKKQGLLYLFTYAKDSFLPMRIKKTF